MAACIGAALVPRSVEHVLPHADVRLRPGGPLFRPPPRELRVRSAARCRRPAAAADGEPCGARAGGDGLLGGGGARGARQRGDDSRVHARGALQDRPAPVPHQPRARRPPHGYAVPRFSFIYSTIRCKVYLTFIKC